MHYLVLVITDQDFRYALISVKEVESSLNHDLKMEDIGWLNVRRIHGDDVAVEGGVGPDPVTGQKRKRDDGFGRTAPSGEDYPTRYGLGIWCGRDSCMLTSTSFRLETKVLRELYAYCWSVLQKLTSDL